MVLRINGLKVKVLSFLLCFNFYVFESHAQTANSDTVWLDCNSDHVKLTDNELLALQNFLDGVYDMPIDKYTILESLLSKSHFLDVHFKEKQIDERTIERARVKVAYDKWMSGYQEEIEFGVQYQGWNVIKSLTRRNFKIFLINETQKILPIGDDVDYDFAMMILKTFSEGNVMRMEKYGDIFFDLDDIEGIYKISDTNSPYNSFKMMYPLREYNATHFFILYNPDSIHQVFFNVNEGVIELFQNYLPMAG